MSSLMCCCTLHYLKRYDVTIAMAPFQLPSFPSFLLLFSPKFVVKVYKVNMVAMLVLNNITTGLYTAYSKPFSF